MIPAGLHLVDTSAIARVSNKSIAGELGELGRQGLLATCVTIDLEVLYSARNPTEYRSMASLRALGFTDLPLHPDIGPRARAIQAALAARGQHRGAGAFDVLTAAIAEHHSAVVVHYDRDFEHIAAVTGQLVRWIAPPGSVD